MKAAGKTTGTVVGNFGYITSFRVTDKTTSTHEETRREHDGMTG